MKLEPSAAAGFAGMPALLKVAASYAGKFSARAAWRNIDNAVHIVWTTGGDLMPDDIFSAFIREMPNY